MGWLDGLKRAGAWLMADAGQLAAPDPLDPRWWGAPTISTVAGATVTPETALGLDVVQSVLDRLGGTISSLPLMVFERTGADTRRPARDHPLYKILHAQPNERQTAQEYRDALQRDLAFNRNALSIIRDGDAGPVGALDPVPWSRVMRVFRAPDGAVYYQVRRLPPASGFDTYREDEVWHIRKAPLTEDGLAGIPIWQTARQTFGKAIAVEQFGALYFANGGSGGGVLEHPSNFVSPKDRDEFLAAWREGGTGLNRHKDRLLLFGLKYTPFSVKNDEAQFLETLKETAVKLCRLWNMPPHLVGILDKATFSNIEQQSIEYVVHTLAPWICGIEQAANRDLLVGQDRDRFFVEFNVAGLLRGDLKTRWAAYAQGRQWGWLSVNDIRQLENMDPIGPDGDRYLEPVNMTAAGEPGADQTTQDPADPADEPKDPADEPEDEQP